MKKAFKIIVLLFALFGLTVPIFYGCATSPGPSGPGIFGAGLKSLSELSDTFALELSRQIPGKKIYLDRTSIRDIVTKDVSNFSAYLQNELESSLSKREFQILYDMSDAEYYIGATYRHYQGMVKVFFKYHKTDLSCRKSLNYEIERSKLPGDSFQENMKSKTYKLATTIVKNQRNLKVYVTPIKEGNHKYTSDFSNSLTSRIKSQIITLHSDIEIIDEKVAQENLSNKRGIKVKAKELKNLKTSDALFAGANAVLEGEYFVEGDTVPVNLYLKKLDGTVLNSASVEIKKVLINSNLENNEAKVLHDLADVSAEQGDFNVKISTTKGGEFPVYYDKEIITFYINVGTPLYVYVYDINPHGEVALLYPHAKDMLQGKLLPDTLYTIPSEMDDYDFEVGSPFGRDIVKIFASDSKLPIPNLTQYTPSRSFSGKQRTIGRKRKKAQEELSNMKSINPKDLVDYYRGISKKMGARLYEDSVLVETKGK
jgi:hypothetical protein